MPEENSAAEPEVNDADPVGEESAPVTTPEETAEATQEPEGSPEEATTEA